MHAGHVRMKWLDRGILRPPAVGASAGSAPADEDAADSGGEVSDDE